MKASPTGMVMSLFKKLVAGKRSIKIDTEIFSDTKCLVSDFLVIEEFSIFKYNVIYKLFLHDSSLF